MRSLGNGIKKAAISIRSKVDGERGTWGNGARHFNIQVDFAIVAIWLAYWIILSTSDRHTCHVRQRDAQPLKVCLQVAVLVASTKFDDRDTLAASINASWKVIELGKL